MKFDEQLPYILQKKNIAYFDEDVLYIGDRRVYPFEKRFHPCTNVEEIALAIKEMVTQGGGPLQVALTTLRWIAHQEGDSKQVLSHLLYAQKQLTQARPTNTTMARTLQRAIGEIAQWFHCSSVGSTHQGDFVSYVDEIVNHIEKQYDEVYDTLSDLGSSLIKDGSGILTTCFAEHSFILSVIKAQRDGKRCIVYVPETRPYLQGSRLSAPSLEEVGIDVRVITDGMGANIMREGKVNLYMTAADLVTMDGTVVNKVGTLANAISASYYNIPYYPFAMSPDTSKEDASSIILEERDGEELLQFQGKRTTSETMRGYYPSFDIIDNTLVTGIITPKGIVTKENIKNIYT